MHLLNHFSNAKWLIIAPLLMLSALTLTGCGLVAGIEEGDSTSPPVSPTVEDSASGTLIIDLVTVPPDQPGAFRFTGVPTGTITAGSTLVVADLVPGTYTTTQVDPAPDFDVTAVKCDDGGSPSPSSGDAQSRAAIFGVDPGETIRCTFTNTQRGSVVIASRTVPVGVTGSFQFTGVPTGTIPANGTLVVANLTPGTYTTTQVDPAPGFDVTAIECNDGGSPTPSSGDARARTAVLNVDAGEMIQCTFTNSRRGTVVVTSRTEPEGASGGFTFTGVPSGTIPANGTLVVANLAPGTYATTEIDPAPGFALTAISCDDGESASASSGDAGTRTAIFNVDPGETVRCTFTNTQDEAEEEEPTVAAGGGSAEGESSAGSGEESPANGTNPFDDPGSDLEGFPLPENLPPGAGTFSAPLAGPWSAVNFAGQMTCEAMTLSIPASPPESGILEVLDGGRTLIGSGLQEGTASITLQAVPGIAGRYAGSIQAIEEGMPVTIKYLWQVVTDRYIIGYLTSSVTSEGIACEVYRSFELNYTG